MICCVLVACNNQDLEITKENVQFSGKNSLSFQGINDVLEFTYNGVHYVSTCIVKGDSLEIENKNVADVYNYLIGLPNLATYCAPDGSVVYFDNYQQCQDYLGINESSNVALRASGYFTLTLYEHKDRGGRSEVFSRYNSGDPNLWSIPDLSVYNFDELMSSFEFKTYPSNNRQFAVTLFRNKNYEAQSITFNSETPMLNIYVPNLKKFYIKRGITWNDRTSSLKAFLKN